VSGCTERGWRRFGHDPGIAAWAVVARAAGADALRDPDLSHWHQCENTWFVGVDALPNDATGAVAGVALDGAVCDAIRAAYGPLPPLHRAQVSAVFPGYPRPRAGETEAAFGYRLRRDAAHVDGLLPVGPDRQRMIREPHAWILGLPLSEASADAAPLVIWEGSHRIIADAFRAALDPHAPDTWDQVDLTAPYQSARRTVFDTCRRVEIAARPGEAYLIHRLALHGVAPWGATATAGPEGRMIAYFRPPWVGDLRGWLQSST